MKELGQFAFSAIDTDVKGYVTYMADLQGWTKEEIMVYAARLRREIRNTAIHGYYLVKVVWAENLKPRTSLGVSGMSGSLLFNQNLSKERSISMQRTIQPMPALKVFSKLSSQGNPE